MSADLFGDKTMSLFRYDAWIKAANGPSVAGSQVYVLGQPANTLGTPSPQLQVYADVNGLLPLVQPLISDGYGHVDFYISGGPFTIGVYFNGILQNSYADQYPMGLGSSGTSILLETNYVANPVQNILNLVAGSNITLAADSSGDVTINAVVPTPLLLQTNGTTNVVQSKLNLSSGTGITLVSDGSGDVTIASALLATNGTPNILQTKLNLVAGTNVSLTSDGSGDVTVASSAGSLPAAYTGDIIRWNVNGDSLWDAVNGAYPSHVMVAVGGAGGVSQYGPHSTGLPSTVGTQSVVYPTSSNPTGDKFSAGATASASPVVGICEGVGSNTGFGSFTGFYRVSMHVAIGVTAGSVRYWMGLGQFTSGSFGPPVSSTTYCFDVPYNPLVCFRYSGGTDTYWMAVTSTNNGGGSNYTAVSTGVVPDTNPHLFEIVYTGSSYIFLIDEVVVATITTHLPSSATTFGTVMFIQGDNKNTATAMNLTVYSMTQSIVA